MASSTLGSPLKITMVIALVLTWASNISFAQDDERMFFVNLQKSKELAGQIVDLGSVKMTTSFGEIEIPMNKIDGIHMHADKNDSAVIAFTNGDILTGKITLNEINLKTGWGKAVVNAVAIESITSDRNTQFYSDPGSGGWRFSRALSQPGSMRPQPDAAIIRNGF